MANLDHSDLLGLRTVLDGAVTDLGGNLQVDPQLVAFKLPAGSPPIDAGTCMEGPAIDFEGDPRPTGAGCDMGWDEFVP